jgi:hypothetical protein
MRSMPLLAGLLSIVASGAAHAAGGHGAARTTRSDALVAFALPQN